MALLPDPLAFVGDGLPIGTVSLTFDDGPGLQTLALATYLHAEDIRATFFVLGNRVDATVAGRPGRDIVREVAALGHTIGNHSYTHPALNETNALPETSRCHSAIASIVEPGPLLLRAPYGAWHAAVAEALNGDAGLSTYVGPVRWSIGEETTVRYRADWQCRRRTALGTPEDSPETCGAGYLREAIDRRRGFILMHDHNDEPGSDPFNTLRLVQWLTPRLKAQQFRICPVTWDRRLAARLRAAGNVCAMPADWWRVDRGANVDWHQLSIYTAGRAHRFTRDPATDRIFWDGQDVGRRGREIAAGCDRFGHTCLAILGDEQDGTIWHQMVAPGAAPSATWQAFAPGTGASALHRLEINPETHGLTCAFWDRERRPRLWSRQQSAPGVDEWTTLAPEPISPPAPAFLSTPPTVS